VIEYDAHEGGGQFDEDLALWAARSVLRPAG